jgi:hypothetical protein
MKSQTTKGSEEAKQQAASVTEMTEAFRKSCEQALRAGLKFQEEAGRWCGTVFNTTDCLKQCQEQFDAAAQVANRLLPLAQKPLGEVIDLAEKNGRFSAELAKKAVEATQASGLAESQAKWTEFWAASLETLQANSEALAQISSRSLGSWADFIQKGSEPWIRRTA